MASNVDTGLNRSSILPSLCKLTKGRTLVSIMSDLMASQATNNTAQNVNVNLATRPGGCVLWLRFDAATLALGPYLWFGSDAGAPAPSLGDIVAKHAKGDRTGLKAPRPNIRVLKQNQFRLLETIDEVAAALFGLRPIPDSGSNAEHYPAAATAG